MKRKNHVNKAPKVSIIIACYNDPFVREAIQKAYEQNYPNKEIIVVNDGSDGHFTELIEKSKSQTDLILNQSNQGQSIARNYGISFSKGDFILNWDSDDYFDPSFCSKAVEIMEDSPEIKLVTCHARRFNSKGTIDIYKPEGGSLRNFLFANGAMGSALFRKKDWKECGGYEQHVPILGFEDWEFYIKLLKTGGYAEVIPEPLFHYRKRRNSTTEKIIGQKAEKFRQIIFLHKEVYLPNFEDLVNNLIYRIARAENESIRRERSLEYQIGSVILKPLRFLKSKLKSKKSDNNSSNQHL